MSVFQVSALDGVLELKGEHFWTIAFGSYVSIIPTALLLVACMSE